MIYPGSSPEFRMFIKKDGSSELQVRYVNITQGYTSKWQPVEIVYEEHNS